ncbi:hypothetical protein H0Z60_13450 [Ectothiorhodospiraceae bacterium WFHF3C12]|nr:hypothetical protein [Ectothiorhodospiraceae bacterium WFHF3C12]
MTPLNDTDFAVLNAAHLNKMAGPASIAAATQLDQGTVDEVLDRAQQNGLGQKTGNQFLIFPDGSKAVLEYYDRTYGELRDSDELGAWYERFETVNTQFIQHITDWQNTGGDEGVEAKLIKTVNRHVRAVEKLLPQIPRYEQYVRRFHEAISKVDRGETDFVCKPTVDSIHNIWFEFHEDILSVLGRPRDTT